MFILSDVNAKEMLCQNAHEEGHDSNTDRDDCHLKEAGLERLLLSNGGVISKAGNDKHNNFFSVRLIFPVILFVVISTLVKLSCDNLSIRSLKLSRGCAIIKILLKRYSPVFSKAIVTLSRASCE